MSEYRWSAERRKDRWPDLAGHFGVRLMFNGEHVITIYRPTEPAAQSLIDWINRTDLGECPEWATLMPVASGAALKANDPDGEWGRECTIGVLRTDHEFISDAVRWPIRRTPAPAEPLTERVPWGDCLGRKLASNGGKIIGVYIELDDGVPIVNTSEPNADRLWQRSPDGTVEVLRRSTEDGKR